MESIAFFEKKLSLSPSDLNELKSTSLQDILHKKAKESMESKCSEQGFVLPGTIEIMSRSMGYFESARFTGDIHYHVKLKGSVIYPIDGVKLTGTVIRKNQMGLYINYMDAIRIQIPRDLHIGNIDYDSVHVGDRVNIELKRSKFAIHDTYILSSGVFLSKEDGLESAEESKDEVVSEVESDSEAKEPEESKVSSEVASEESEASEEEEPEEEEPEAEESEEEEEA